MTVNVDCESATAVHEMVGTTVACHKGIAGLVCVSLDRYATEYCTQCVCAQEASEV